MTYTQRIRLLLTVLAVSVLATPCAAKKVPSAGEPIILGTVYSMQGHPEISNVFFTTHAYLGEDNDDPQIAAFRRAYTQAYPEAPPDAFAALGYDAARLVLTAIRQAKSTDPDAVRAALASTRSFDGVTGQMGYPDTSRIPVKAVTILKINQGTYRLIQQLSPAKAPAP